MSSGKQYKVVAYGRNIGIMTDSKDVQEATSGFQGYRVFVTDDLCEAKAYLELYRGIPADGKPVDKKQLELVTERIRAEEPVKEESDKVPVGVVVREEKKEEYSPLDVVVYTDASYLPLQKSGGCAAILLFGGSEDVKIQVSRGKKHGESSFFMELLAFKLALKKLSKYNVTGKVYFYTDSKEVVDALYCNYGALQEYKARQDAIREELYKYNYEIKWVKAHSGNVYNEECDRVSKVEARLAALA